MTQLTMKMNFCRVMGSMALCYRTIPQSSTSNGAGDTFAEYHRLTNRIANSWIESQLDDRSGKFEGVFLLSVDRLVDH